MHIKDSIDRVYDGQKIVEAKNKASEIGFLDLRAKLAFG